MHRPTPPHVTNAYEYAGIATVSPRAGTGGGSATAPAPARSYCSSFHCLCCSICCNAICQNHPCLKIKLWCPLGLLVYLLVGAQRLYIRRMQPACAGSIARHSTDRKLGNRGQRRVGRRVHQQQRDLTSHRSTVSMSANATAAEHRHRQWLRSHRPRPFQP